MIYRCVVFKRVCRNIYSVISLHVFLSLRFSIPFVLVLVFPQKDNECDSIFETTTLFSSVYLTNSR